MLFLKINSEKAWSFELFAIPLHSLSGTKQQPIWLKFRKPEARRKSCKRQVATKRKSSLKRLHKTEYVVQEADESDLIWVKKWTRQEIDR